MALTAYLDITGQTSGALLAPAQSRSKDKKLSGIPVIAASHQLSVPHDAPTMQFTGTRVHQPFSITKEVDATSPLLYQMLVTSDVCTKWELRFFRTASGIGAAAKAGGGAIVLHYTVKLGAARVSDIRFRMLNVRDPELAKYAEFEEVSFVYQTIEWTWVQGGITAEDENVAGLA